MTSWQGKVRVFAGRRCLVALALVVGCRAGDDGASSPIAGGLAATIDEAAGLARAGAYREQVIRAR